MSGVRSSSRNKKRRWVMYAGKGASWSGAAQSRAAMHHAGSNISLAEDTEKISVSFYDTMKEKDLENITMLFWNWRVQDDAEIEDFTMVESLMINRFALLRDDKENDARAGFRAMKSYGIFPVTQDIIPCNDKVDLNAVQGSLVKREVIAARIATASTRYTLGLRDQRILRRPDRRRQPLTQMERASPARPAITTSTSTRRTAASTDQHSSGRV